MQIENDIKLDFADVLIKPKRSTLTSRKEVELYRVYKTLHSNREFLSIPIIAANMTGVGTIEMAKALGEHGLLTALSKFIPPKELVENSSVLWKCFISIGMEIPDYLEDLSKLQNGCLNICIDVANGYTEEFVQHVRNVRERFPNAIIMAGNVITREITEQLILAGADIVKCGIGPGAVCTTRKVTGVGYPQLSGINECADAAHGLGGLVCADGGVQVVGDIAKAFGAGADFVMMGSMFAGHDEGGQVSAGSDRVKFHGMSSKEAMQMNYGKMADYRSSEGKEVTVEYKGPVKNTVKHILGGLRSACTYVGARKLKELSKRTTFVRVNRQLNTMFGNG